MGKSEQTCAVQQAAGMRLERLKWSRVYLSVTTSLAFTVSRTSLCLLPHPCLLVQGLGWKAVVVAVLMEHSRPKVPHKHPQHQQQLSWTGMQHWHSYRWGVICTASTAAPHMHQLADCSVGVLSSDRSDNSKVAPYHTCLLLCNCAASASQEFASAGDTSHLDFPGLCAVLAAAAAQHSQATRPEHAPMLQRLQQQLQNLSVDAFHVLLEELLLRANSTAAAINSSSGGAGGGGGGQVSDAGLAFLLSHALLPKLLTLSGAAPKSMLACLTALGVCWTVLLCFSVCARPLHLYFAAVCATNSAMLKFKPLADSCCCGVLCCCSGDVCCAVLCHAVQVAALCSPARMCWLTRCLGPWC